MEAAQTLVLKSGTEDDGITSATTLELQDGFAATAAIKVDAIEAMTSNTTGIRLGNPAADSKYGFTVAEQSWINHETGLGEGELPDPSAGTLITFKDKAKLVAGGTTATHIGMADGVVETQKLMVHEILEGGIDDHTTDENRELVFGSGTTAAACASSGPTGPAARCLPARSRCSRPPAPRRSATATS